MIESKEFKKYLDFAHKAYQENNAVNQTHRQNGKVPYITHPLGSAMLLIADTDISYEERELGFKILILHDVLENTSLELPTWIDKEVQDGVKEMTYQGGENVKDKIKWVWEKNSFYRLLVLYDVFWTLYEKHVSGSLMRKKLWQEGVLVLAKEVEKDYGTIQIVKIAKSISKDTY